MKVRSAPSGVYVRFARPEAAAAAGSRRTARDRDPKDAYWAAEDLDTFADSLDAVRVARGRQRWSVIGHSYGSFIAATGFATTGAGVDAGACGAGGGISARP